MEQEKELHSGPSQQVINEILYYGGLQCMKQLCEQGKLKSEQLTRANTALAKQYGVLPYII